MRPGGGHGSGFPPPLPVRFTPHSVLRFRITAPKRGVSAPPPPRLGFSLPLPVGFATRSCPPPGRMVVPGGRVVPGGASVCRARGVPLDTIRNNSNILTKKPGTGKKCYKNIGEPRKKSKSYRQSYQQNLEQMFHFWKNTPKFA